MVHPGAGPRAEGRVRRLLRAARGGEAGRADLQGLLLLRGAAGGGRADPRVPQVQVVGVPDVRRDEPLRAAAARARGRLALPRAQLAGGARAAGGAHVRRRRPRHGDRVPGRQLRVPLRARGVPGGGVARVARDRGGGAAVPAAAEVRPRGGDGRPGGGGGARAQDARRPRRRDRLLGGLAPHRLALPAGGRARPGAAARRAGARVPVPRPARVGRRRVRGPDADVLQSRRASDTRRARSRC